MSKQKILFLTILTPVSFQAKPYENRELRFYGSILLAVHSGSQIFQIFREEIPSVFMAVEPVYLLKERKVELALEGLRWYDLRRWEILRNH